MSTNNSLKNFFNILKLSTIFYNYGFVSLYRKSFPANFITNFDVVGSKFNLKLKKNESVSPLGIF